MNKNYDEKCDLWSIGVILYTLLCGYPPFNGETDDKIMKKVLKGKFKLDEEDQKDISKEAKDLVRKLLTFKPEDRINAAEALQHPWIEENSKIDICQHRTRKTLANLRNFQGTSKLK